MDEDNQILVPPSFVQLCSDARGRLTQPPAHVRERHELCEDLACGLVEQAQWLYHREAPDEAGVLATLHAALATPDTGLNAAEARWVTLRLAELLGWRSPDLPMPELNPR